MEDRLATTTAPPDTLATYVPRLLHLRADDPRPSHWESEGSLVFADVSGFTRLTERLQRNGKAGAEEMVTTISSIFTALLSATEDGGDVLKFGGDALLIFYSGDDHAVRACHAAQGMQRALVRAGAIDSSQGRVRLRMSVGIHSGTFPFFLVGDGDHLELVVLGEPASTTTEMESAADAGEVLVSPATAAMLDPSWLKTAKAPGLLLGRVPEQPPLLVVDPDPTAETDVAVFIPPLLRDRLGHRSEEHEHRRVAISFTHVGGTDELIRQCGPREVFDRVNALTCVVQEAVRDLGILIVATDIAGNGFKFMLAAGAPDASEDDEARLLHTARRIVEADVGLPVRVGVNHGHVFAGDVGAPFRRTYSTMGDAVNLAARVMGKAPWGEVLATDGVVERARGRFAFRALPPFQVKGKRRPVSGSLVGPPTSGTVTVRDDVTMVGRRAELAALDQVAREVRATGRGQVVEIVGDLGAGKSRLALELRRHDDPDTPWLTIAGDHYDRTSPYQVARRLLRQALEVPADAEPSLAGRILAEQVRTAAPELAPYLPLLAIPLDAEVAPTPEVDRIANEFRGARMRSAVAALLRAVLDDAIVLVDDAHHIDDASGELLDAVLLETVPQRPWVVFVTRRPDVAGWRPAEAAVAKVVHLGPLSSDEAHEFVALASEQAPFPAHLHDVVVDRGNGNPLFLLELVRTASTGNATQLDGSLASIVAARIDALDHDDRHRLRLLSVLGERFDLALADEVLGDLGVRSSDEGTWQRLSEFVRRQGHHATFQHDLVREGAYEGLTYRRRKEVHGRVADALASRAGTRPWQLSQHLLRAERWMEAWQASCAAGDDARSSYAHVEAAELYRRALVAASHLELSGDEVARVAELRGDSCEISALYEDAAPAYTLALRHVAEPTDRARLHRKRGVLHERVGRYPQALRWYTRGLRSLTGSDDPTHRSERAALLLAYAGVRYRQGKLEACVTRALEAIDEAAPVQDLPRMAHGYYLLDATYTDLGREEEADRFRYLALPVYEELGDLVGQANVLNNLGVNAYFAGDLEEARRLYERSRDARAAAGDVIGAAQADNNIGEVLSDLGDHDGAETLFRQALRVCRGAHYPLVVALATANLGTVAVRRGETSEGERLLREALAMFEELGATGFVADVQGRLAELE